MWPFGSWDRSCCGERRTFYRITTYLDTGHPQNSPGQSIVWASCRWTRTRGALCGRGRQPPGCWSWSGLYGSFWKAGKWCVRRRSETGPQTSPAQVEHRKWDYRHFPPNDDRRDYFPVRILINCISASLSISAWLTAWISCWNCVFERFI